MNVLHRVREATEDFVWELRENARKIAWKIALGAVCVLMLFVGAALGALAGGEESAGTLVQTRTNVRTVTVKTPPRTLARADKTVTSIRRAVVTTPGRTSTITEPRAASVITAPGTTATRTLTDVETVTVTLPGTTKKVTETRTQTQTVTETETVTETVTECPGNSC